LKYLCIYKKKEENVSYLLVVVVFTEIKRAVTMVAIAASKKPMVSKDKNAQSGEHGQQKYPPHNLTNMYIYLWNGKRTNYSPLVTLILSL
jgi:hypothetical protein